MAVAQSSLEITPISSQNGSRLSRDSMSNWLARDHRSNVKSVHRSGRTTTRNTTPYQRSASNVRKLHASCSARRLTSHVASGRRRSASAASVVESEENTTYLKGLVNKTWKIHRMSPMYKFSVKTSSLRLYARHLSAHVQSISSNQMVLVEESADLAQIKPLKLSSADGSKILRGVEIELLQHPKRGGGPARVVLTAVMCTTEDQSADVTLGGVDSESTCLPLVLVRGPVQLRRMLFTWWQHQFDCCISEMPMSPMELSWVVGMFSGFIPDSRARDVELVYKLPDKITKMSRIVYRINAQDCRQLWLSIHSSDDDSFHADEVVSFIHAIEEHLYQYFRIKLAALQLSRVGTSILCVSADGLLKMYSLQHALQIISHLVFIVREVVSNNTD